MSRVLHFLIVCATLVGWSRPASAQIVVISTFNPTSAGDFCGIGRDPITGNLWAYPCSGADILGFSITGEAVGTLPRAGESTNDVDVTFSTTVINLNGTTILPGTLLFINGETGPSEIYAMSSSGGDPIDTLVPKFGVSHVVGGSYHPLRNTFFLVQDNVPGTVDQNRVAEINPVTGDTIRTFQITDIFNVSFGDLEVSEVTGNLFIVSSIQNTIAEFSPNGALVQKLAIPAGVGNLTGIALDCSRNEAWVTNTTGGIFRLGGVPCGLTTGVENEKSAGARPGAIVLHPNSPNPFSTSTTVTFDLPETGSVELQVYDLAGKPVKHLQLGVLSAGRHKRRLDLAEAGAGTYLYEIRVIDGSTIRFRAGRTLVLSR